MCEQTGYSHYTNSDWHEVVIQNIFPEVRKMLPQGWRLRATFYELKGKNFQWWLMMPVTICFVIPQNQNKKKLKQKSLSTHFSVCCSLLPTPSSAGNSVYLSTSHGAIGPIMWYFVLRYNKVFYSLLSIYVD